MIGPYLRGRYGYRDDAPHITVSRLACRKNGSDPTRRVGRALETLARPVRARTIWLALLVGAGLLLCTTAHAAPCPRAYRLPAGATAPCAGELLPSPTVDALLQQMDTARRLKVQLDEDAAHAAAAAREAEAKATAADKAHRAEVEAVERAGAARLAAADAHVAELERQVRELARPEPEHWTAPRIIAALAAGAAAVVGGV